MARRLGNTAIKAGLEHRDYVAAVADAARKAKVRVEFRAGPVPGSGPAVADPQDPGYGHMVTHEGMLCDLSEFWSLYALALVRITNEKGL